jgi:hypothetical protein
MNGNQLTRNRIELTSQIRTRGSPPGATTVCPRLFLDFTSILNLHEIINKQLLRKIDLELKDGDGKHQHTIFQRKPIFYDCTRLRNGGSRTHPQLHSMFQRGEISGYSINSRFTKSCPVRDRTADANEIAIIQSSLYHKTPENMFNNGSCQSNRAFNESSIE